MYPVKILFNLMIIISLLSSLIIPGAVSAAADQALALDYLANPGASDLVGPEPDPESEEVIALPAEASADWWGRVEDDIGRAEYQISPVAQPDLSASTTVYQIGRASCRERVSNCV